MFGVDGNAFEKVGSLFSPPQFVPEASSDQTFTSLLRTSDMPEQAVEPCRPLSELLIEGKNPPLDRLYHPPIIGERTFESTSMQAIF